MFNPKAYGFVQVGKKDGYKVLKGSNSKLIVLYSQTAEVGQQFRQYLHPDGAILLMPVMSAKD